MRDIKTVNARTYHRPAYEHPYDLRIVPEWYGGEIVGTSHSVTHCANRAEAKSQLLALARRLVEPTQIGAFIDD